MTHALGFILTLSVLGGAPVEREVVDGIMTSRIIQGEPYALAGKRIVFTNWHYVQPGDLDWRNAAGESVYVHGDEGLFDAYHVGVNAPRGVRLTVAQPEVRGPLSRPSRTTLRDGDVYKGWTSERYYESSDALQWEEKGMLTFDKPVNDGLGHIFIDPSAPPEERFKGTWVGSITRAEFEAFRQKRPDGWEPRALIHLEEQDKVACLMGGVSANGIHWRVLPDPLVVEYADTLNTAYYDATLRKYVLYTRYWSLGPRTDTLPPDIRNSWTGVGRRAIGRSESADFSAFPPSEMILEPSPNMLPSEALYTNCRTTVPGAPEQHLLFPAVWNASIDDTTRIVLATSHNGKVWHWAPEGTVLRTQAFGQWDGGCVWTAPELIELPNGDWALPYIGHNLPHKYPRGQRQGGEGYAVWPKGRMMALEAQDRGECTLIPVMPPGTRLKINAVTARTGWVRVEVRGVQGRTLEDCVKIVGDQHWASVKWKDGGDLGAQEGQPVTLRLELNQAKIFGIEFE
jgi:hypothetical protein